MMETQTSKLNDRQKAQAKALNEALSNIEDAIKYTPQGSSANEVARVAQRNIQYGNLAAAEFYIQAHLNLLPENERHEPPNVNLKETSKALRKLPKKGI